VQENYEEQCHLFSKNSPVETHTKHNKDRYEPKYSEPEEFGIFREVKYECRQTQEFTLRLQESKEHDADIRVFRPVPNLRRNLFFQAWGE
jgi:hypothetical protein